MLLSRCSLAVILVNRATSLPPLEAVVSVVHMDRPDLLVGQNHWGAPLTMINPDPRTRMLVRVEINDDRNPDRNPNMVICVPLDDAVFWDGVPPDVCRTLSTATTALRSRFARGFKEEDPSRTTHLTMTFFQGESSRMAVECVASAEGRCMVCRALSRKTCSKCLRAPYCSRECQCVDYKSHKGMCNADPVYPACRECFSVYVEHVRIMLQGVPR